MSDIRHSLLRRDALSAAKEVLYHLDIYFSSQLQSAPLPLVDKGPAELLEEFLFQVPKERGAPPKVRPDPARPEGMRGLGWCWRTPSCERPAGPLFLMNPQCDSLFCFCFLPEIDFASGTSAP